MLIGPIRHSYTAIERNQRSGIPHIVIPRYTRTDRINEDKKVPLGGMAWDEVSYQLYCAINKDCLFTLEELKEKFPYLLK